MELAEQPLIGEGYDQYRRVFNDTTTWLAEALDGFMLTPFEYTFDGRELYADDGSPMGDVFLDALADAERLVAEKPELGFELRRRRIELGEYADMIKMARGDLPNTMIVVSDFPPELMHATKDVGGYNVSRKQTMLRMLTWDGSRLKMYSQSLDGSNRVALEEVFAACEYTAEAGELLGQRIHRNVSAEEQAYLIAQLTGVYDRGLERQYGGSWHAGRREEPRDTYQFVLSEHALVDYFTRQALARRPTDQDRYNMAALMWKRFEGRDYSQLSISEAQVSMGGLIGRDMEWQLQTAGEEARSVGKTFSGCGISIDAGRLSANEQLAAAGYGNGGGGDTDNLGSRWFPCPKGHLNYRRIANVAEPNCKTCGVDVSCKPPKRNSNKQKPPTISRSVFAVKSVTETIKKRPN